MYFAFGDQSRACGIDSSRFPLSKKTMDTIPQSGAEYWILKLFVCYSCSNHEFSGKDII
jgi:hypothetical protein